MAASTTNYDATMIQVGHGAQFWTGLAIPAASSRMTVVSGTPDGTENPSAVHLGLTEGGSTIEITPTFEKYYADEFASPVKQKMTGLDVKISCNLLQVADEDIWQKVMAGFGTYTTASGYKQATLGIGTQAFNSLALIWPLEAAPTTYYGILHLYQAQCTSGLAGLTISRKGMSSIATVWEGTSVTTRAATDTVGNWWKSTA